MNQEGSFADKVRVRSCAVIIDQGKILLIKQKAPTRMDPIWLPPGGGVEMGESSREAVVREVFEETHLTISPKQLLYIHEFIEPPYHAVEVYYLSEIISGNLKKGSDPELDSKNQQIVNCEFVEISQLGNISLYPEFLMKEISNLNNQETLTSVKHFISS